MAAPGATLQGTGSLTGVSNAIIRGLVSAGGTQQTATVVAGTFAVATAGSG